MLQDSAETIWIGSVAGDEINASGNVGINLECTKTGEAVPVISHRCSFSLCFPAVTVEAQLQNWHV